MTISQARRWIRVLSEAIELASPQRTAPWAEAPTLWHGLAHHEHLAHGFGCDQPHEPTVGIDHADGGCRLFLQDAEGLVEAAALVHDWDIRGHGLANASLGP